MMSFKVFYFIPESITSVYSGMLLIFLTMIFFTILAFMVAFLLEKGEEAIDLNRVVYELEKEKKLRESLFKITHEIKNPLMPIVMNAEIIERNLKNNMSDKDIEKIKNSTTIIIKNANSISNLIKSFSEFSFAIKISDKKESINEVILEVLDSFKNIPNIKFKVSLTKHDYYLNMDRDKLIMSCRNLIKNSIEAMENNNIESIIYLSSYHEIIDYKEFFTVSITDTGIGIENNNIKRIFEPYFTSKSKGTGIGLATTEKIIMEHKGYISVESIIGEGSTFFIRFEI